MSGGRFATSALAAANAALAVPVGYLGGLTLVSLVASRRQPPLRPAADPTTRFVVLVPAHDEATTISTMLRGVFAQEYPAALFQVHVVADNCTDETASIAAALGARVHERHDRSSPGKGPALNWLVDRLVADDVPFDAAVFIDADTTIAVDFLRVLDRRFRNGSIAVQGFYGVREAFESTPATLRYCALAARHHCRPLARTAIGGSCGLFGNGMAFARQLVIDRSWSSHLVEDMEFQLDLLLSGVRVEYEPLARLEAEMPHTFADSVTQHQRWEVGRFDLVRRYLPRLVARVARPAGTSRIAAADAVADLCVPPLSLLAVATGASAGLGAVLAAFSPNRSRWHFVGGILLATLCCHVLASLRLVGAPSRAYRSLLHAPRLAVWKMSVLLRSIIGADTDWVRTRRNAERSMQDGSDAGE